MALVPGVGVGVAKEHYDPTDSEFTLFYFADSTCRNCRRFGPILATFLHDVNDSEANNALGAASA